MVDKPFPARGAGIATPKRPMTDKEKKAKINARVASYSHMASSLRPKPRPAGLKDPAEMKSSMRPTTRSDYETEKDVEAAAKGYKAGGMISEYGGKEKYSSKASMMKHEKAESPSMERGEKKMAKGGKLKMVSKGGKKVPAFAADGVGKMAMGGMCRGMGAATKGGKYKA